MDGNRNFRSLVPGPVSPSKSHRSTTDPRFPDGSYYRSEMSESWAQTSLGNSTDAMQLDAPLPTQDLPAADRKLPLFSCPRSNDSLAMSISPTNQQFCLLHQSSSDLGPRLKDAKRPRPVRDSLDPQHKEEADYSDVTSGLKKVFLPVPEMCSIRVKTLSGRSLTFECEQSSIILQLKQEIENALGIPVSDQRLLLGGSSLADFKTFADYNITDGSTIYMVVSLHGG